MKLLALDTSSAACSAALQLDGDVEDRHVVEPKAHSRLLIPMLQSLLEQGGCELSDLDALVLGNGPGSFIGLRIAASVAQGLSHGSGIPLVPVSSLAAVAMQCISDDEAGRVLVAQDARMSEVYLAEFKAGASGLAEAVGEVTLQPAASIERLTPSASARWVAAGEGWHRYPALLDANRNLLSAISEVRLPQARWLLALGEAALKRGLTVDPAELTPAYVRQTVAKIPGVQPDHG